jgi:hypothetical protein
MKQIYNCKYIFKIRYEKEIFFQKNKGFFKTKVVEETHTWRDSEPVFAENEEEAKKIFETFIYWKKNRIGHWWSNDSDYYFNDDNYVVLNKAMEIYQENHTFDELKHKMNSDMFLAYCRQELYSLEALIK